MKKLLWLTAAPLVYACTSNPPAPVETAESAPPSIAAEQAIAAAESAVKRADSAGFAWRDSEDLIADAKEAAKKGDFSTAVTLAKTAEKQGQLALIQAESQKEAAPR